jgi:vancomycin resistance protein VanW
MTPTKKGGTSVQSWGRRLLVGAAALPPLLIGAAGFAYLAQTPPPQTRISGFATRLADRTNSQRHNARLAAQSLDGAVIPPGGVFSFNKRVNSWSLDQGYVKAPVSYDGDLVPAFGGGVCQTSTTLYNAALLAGLEVVERHHHVFAPHYVAPGRDAAVAYPNIDLRLRNPHPFPVRIRVQTDRERMEVQVWGAREPAERVTLASRALSTVPPPQLVRRAEQELKHGRGFSRSVGATGFRIVTYRVVSRVGKEVKRDRLSDDTYPAMPQVITYRDRD